MKIKKLLSLLFTFFILLSSALLFSCVDSSGVDRPRPESTEQTLNILTRGFDEDIASNFQIHTFQNGGSMDKKFKRTLLSSWQDTKIKSTIETGSWRLAMVSSLDNSVLTPPVYGEAMDAMTMYVYNPTYNSVFKRSDNASEIFTAYPTVNVQPDETVELSQVEVTRNVAMVKMVVSRATNNFNTSSESHLLKLDKVPSTLSYSGKLLPSKENPTTLAQPLVSQLTLKSDNSNPSYLVSDTVVFLIPAHRGSDFTASDPSDVTSLKMDLSVELERVGGSKFTSTKTIPLVAKCNKILLVKITVDDGMEFTSSILPWNEVELSPTVGMAFSNWVYVKKGSQGRGQSWNDALGNINDALTVSNTLRTNGYTVHGILVAGGADKVYTEGITLPEGTKIYGGWEGKSGTELPAAQASAPHTSLDRNLAKYKAVLSVGSSSVTLDKANTALDGFIVEGASSNNTKVVDVAHATASINAMEIRDNAIGAGYALTITSGTATNILFCNNDQGIKIASGKLVNSTITNNKGSASSTNGTIQNSIVWGNSSAAYFSFTGSNTIQYCALQGTVASMPVGTGNVPIHATNTTWFTVSNAVPGPHFHTTTNNTKPYYSALSDRSPMLRRGNKAAFENCTSHIPTDAKKDINGNPRYHNGIDGNPVSDIGCYEDHDFAGFQLKWATDQVYISSKSGFTSELPLMLPGNELTSIGISWTLTQKGTMNYCTLDPSTLGGSGSGVVVGEFKVTPTVEYTGNTERKCGTMTVSSNLGPYLPDADLDVWQVPGQSVVWTQGYAGSFHRYNETSERLVFGRNLTATNVLLTGEWTVRILSGLDWIKIDKNPKGYNGGEVVETWGGVIKGNTVSGQDELISFRIGLKSTLTSSSSQPRYGLIGITRGTGTNKGTALFFVRQGESADYLYGPNDPRPGGPRTEAIKFSPFNLTDPQGRFAAGGVNLGKNGGEFVDFPSKTGYFFKWNDVIAYYPDNSITGTNVSSTYQTATTWNTNLEPCPSGYFTPTDPQFVHSFFLDRNPNNSGAGSAAGTTFVWGRIADGYYDRLSTNSGDRYVGTGPNRATEGLLMYSNYTYASVFFPMAGYRNGSTFSNDYIQWTQTSSSRSTTQMWHTHNYGNGATGHLGMSCTARYKYDGLSVRCVKQ